MVQVSSFSDAEESSSSSGNSNTNSNNSGLKQNNSKPVLRQIMVPPALAASLQATGRQLMVITGPGGKKMIALRPLTSTGIYSSLLDNAPNYLVVRCVNQKRS